ncbi:MAG TPA: GFA family protein [Rhizomicrobium sp.]|nr:GFA family protein [Rhizomicrobium sp.]
MRKGRPKHPASQAVGRCLCGKVEIAIDTPVFWAWHDHGRSTQRAQGCACATYVGCWKSKLRVAKGAKSIASFEDPKTRAVRSFCSACGTPLFYERAGRGRMINIPRALFDGRVGREPLYHLNFAESAEWEYRNEPLRPLKGYPGVLWTGLRRRKRPPAAPF